jgi:precorrin-6A/cobalt-precorrin-6A reductase
VGGTSETGPLAERILSSGHEVLVSQATEAELDLPEDARLALRRGRLDCDGFRRLLEEFGISRVVDASHPFAVELHRELESACVLRGVPRIRFERPVLSKREGAVQEVPDHQAAAHAAVGHGKPVLLTTGSRNLGAYVDAARAASVPLFARVLPGCESEEACRRAGLPPGRIEFARGPFSVAQTRCLLRRWGIGVLVAKDGGLASGLAERLEAARREAVPVVLVRRPGPEPGAVGSIAEVLERIADPDATLALPGNRTTVVEEVEHGS